MRDKLSRKPGVRMVASFHVYVYVYVRVPACVFHYENTPIQIFRKNHLQKLKIFRQKKV